MYWKEARIEIARLINMLWKQSGRGISDEEKQAELCVQPYAGQGGRHKDE